VKISNAKRNVDIPVKQCLSKGKESAQGTSLLLRVTNQISVISKIRTNMIQRNMNVVLTFQCMICIVGGHTYNKADTSQFGNCAILIKRFQDNANTIDMTSLVTFNQISSKQYPLFSVYDSNETLQIIQPILNVKEECSLNVIVGYTADSYLALYNYMVSNRYTFTSHPHATYIILGDYDNVPVLFYTQTFDLSVSIFLLYIPTKTTNSDSLNSGPLYDYFCFSCKKLLQRVEYNNNIRFLNDDRFVSKWKISKLIILVRNTVSYGDITTCDRLVWKKWLSSIDDFKSNPGQGCNKQYAFWGLVFRSVNLTAQLSISMDSSVVGYSGSFIQEFLNNDITPWRASSAHYHASAFSYIMYCDCDRRTDIISFNTWTTCFFQNAWFSIIVSIVAVASIKKDTLTCRQENIYKIRI
jgi:hypothetical protein